MPAFTHGQFCWNELMTHDLARIKTFYADTIGWTFRAMSQGEMTYWIIKNGDQEIGGIFEMKGPDFRNMPEVWLPYIAVDDVDARYEKAIAGGAKVMRPPFDVPGIGRIALIREPGDAMIGMITPVS